MIANTLLIRKALTNAVMKAKINRPVPIGPMNSPTLLFDSSTNVSWSTTSVFVGEYLGDLLLDGGDVFAISDADVDGVELAFGPQHLGGRRWVPQGERGAAEAVAVAEPDGRGEGERVAAGRRHDVDLIADLEVVVVGRVLVEGHLVRTDRSFAIEQANRFVRIGAVPRGSEHWRPAGCHGFALLVDDLGGALQRAVGVGDSGNGGDGVDEVGGHRITGRLAAVAGVVTEGEGGADLQVGVRVGVAEQRVEAGAHAVGEHERADDEGHAEDDGDGDGDEAADAGAHAAARQEEGDVATHRRLSRSASSGRARRRPSE